MRTIAICAFGAALIAAGSGPARADLVTNGGFETGDFTGWTVAGDGLTIDNSSGFAVSGTYDASFGSAPGDPNPGILSQVITPTTPGADYTLSFSLLDESGANVDAFTVAFGGFSTTITGDTTPGWTAESFLVPGGDVTNSSTTLSFEGSNVSAAWNLDDVSIDQAAIPEPPIGLALLVASCLGVMTRLYRKRA